MAEIAGFNQLLAYMSEADVFSGVLPFLLSYIVFFLVMQRLPLLNGDENDLDAQKYSALISLILAFFVANFLTQNPMYQSFFSNYLGTIMIGMVGILGVMVMLELTGYDVTDWHQPGFGILILAGAIAAFFVSGGVTAYIPGDELPNLAGAGEAFNYLLESGLIWLIVIGGVVLWASSSNKDSERRHLFPILYGNDGGDGSGE